MFASDALNNAGSRALENYNIYIPGGLKYENTRYFIPSSMNHSLNHKSVINPTIINKIYPIRK